MHVFLTGINIERTVKDSIKLFNHTPPSAAIRKYDNPLYRIKAPEEDKFLNLPVSMIKCFNEECMPYLTVSYHSLFKLMQLRITKLPILFTYIAFTVHFSRSCFLNSS